MQIRACDVCAAFGDPTNKPVEYCSKCNAWICATCRPRTLRRGVAMMLHRLLGR